MAEEQFSLKQIIGSKSLDYCTNGPLLKSPVVGFTLHYIKCLLT